MTDPVIDEFEQVVEQATQAPQVERKPLSAAQQRRLRVLAERRDAAQGALDEFIGYLTEEHDAPVQDGWRLSLEAFERQNGA